MSFQDKFIRYSDCKATFVFSASEQEFFAHKGSNNAPKWCPSCRQAIKSERYGN